MQAHVDEIAQRIAENGNLPLEKARAGAIATDRFLTVRGPMPLGEMISAAMFGEGDLHQRKLDVLVGWLMDWHLVVAIGAALGVQLASVYLCEAIAAQFDECSPTLQPFRVLLIDQVRKNGTVLLDDIDRDKDRGAN